MKHFLKRTICFALLFTMCVCLCGCTKTADTYVTASNICIQGEALQCANERQMGSPDALCVYNNRLYFYISSYQDSMYNRCISVFKDGTAEVVLDLSENGETLLLFNDGYAYLEKEAKKTSEEYVYNVYAFHLETKEKTFLMQTGLAYDDVEYFFDEGGNLYLQADGKGVYCRVNGTTCGSPENVQEEYALGDRSYYIGDYKKLTARNHDGTTTKVDLPGYEKWILPCYGGLLVHLIGAKDTVYFIDAEGNLSNLFTIDAVTTRSAVNFYENYVFVSVFRLGELGPLKLAPQPYEDDTLSGTYRIDLNDHSCVKINDSYYCSLFIFDGLSIYALDEDDNIYQLDFDGNLVDELLRIE